jgi:hypothetical protein
MKFDQAKPNCHIKSLDETPRHELCALTVAARALNCRSEGAAWIETKQPKKKDKTEMPLVRIKAGLLRVASRRELPGFPVDPGYGVEEGLGEIGGEEPDQGLPGYPGFPERPAHPIVPPKPPPGVSLPIPPTPEYPMVPIPPESETPGQLPSAPPGMVWPPIRPEFPPDLGNKYLIAALLWIPGQGYKAHWVVVDIDARPPLPGHLPAPPVMPQPK